MAKKIWSNANVDLNLLVSAVQDFFDERGFLTAVENSCSHGFVVRAEASDIYNVNGFVEVYFNKCLRDLVISFDFNKNDTGYGVGPLTMSFFGAGIFFVERLKSRENMVRLERDFWKFVDNVLSNISKDI
ncbi:hypothetical protein KEJ45_00665 [Candidatus Bathyarchaeota archaeon]|nr:hypothetical protein [Candidatus Bathyarchaeota archaeon]